MENFEKEFIMELFLENESVSTMNRLLVAATDVVKEISENNCKFEKACKKESQYWIPELNSQCLNEPLSVRKHKIPEHQLSGNLPKHRLKSFDDDFVSKLTESEFEKTFKMKRSTFQELLNALQSPFENKMTIIPLEKKLQVFLYTLTSVASFAEVGNLFGVKKSSVSYIFYEISELVIDQLRYNMICWPSLEDQQMIKLRVQSTQKFPNCVGFIDACRLKIGSKTKSKEKIETVLLQAVCDDSLMFTDIYINENGKIKKSKAFKESPLFKELSNFVASENHILGDSQYKLRPNLITPFTSEELLTIEEMLFNETHWKARSYIGHAFEILKERFQKLNFMDINKLETVKNIVTVACILHNFILIHEGSPQVKQEIVICEDGLDIDPDIVRTAQEKRQFLCDYINFNESNRT